MQRIAFVFHFVGEHFMLMKHNTNAKKAITYWSVFHIYEFSTARAYSRQPRNIKYAINDKIMVISGLKQTWIYFYVNINRVFKRRKCIDVQYIHQVYDQVTVNDYWFRSLFASIVYKFVKICALLRTNAHLNRGISAWWL